MEMFSLSAASVHGTSNFAQINQGVHDFLIPSVPPGNSLEECVNFAFSGQFRKYINASTPTPPLTTLGNINDYLASCVCKIYNETFPSLKDIPSYVKNTPANPPEPPDNYNIYSIAKLPPILQRISNFFFKVYIPYKDNEPGREGSGFIANYQINLSKESANTRIRLELYHQFAHDTFPATNRLSSSIWCSASGIGQADADKRVVAFVKDLHIKYFKNMGAKVYVNGELI